MDFDSLKAKGEELLNEHGDQIDQGADKLGNALGDKFGHEEQIDQAVDKLQEFTPEKE